jgi:hypothetical protein
VTPVTSWYPRRFDVVDSNPGFELGKGPRQKSGPLLIRDPMNSETQFSRHRYMVASFRPSVGARPGEGITPIVRPAPSCTA